MISVAVDQHRNHTLTPDHSAPVLKTSSHTPTLDTIRTSARTQISPPKIMTQGAVSVNSFRLTTMSSMNQGDESRVEERLHGYT